MLSVRRPAGRRRTKGEIAVLWSVIVLLLIALIGGAILGVIVAFGLNAVVELWRSFGRRRPAQRR